MSDIRLSNGCTKSILAEWSEKAWAHSVTTSSQMLKELPEAWRECGSFKGEVSSDNGEVLFVGFDYLGGNYDAIFFANTQEVAIILNATIDEEEFIECSGVMTVDSFFAFLDSMPNMKKFFIPSLSGE
jgi:hypothetical protein